MFSLLNPTTAIAVLLALIGAFGYGHHVAYVEQAAEIARLNAIEQIKEKAMKAEADKKANALKQENEDAQKKIDSLKSAVADGSVRLSIATRAVQASTASRSTCGAGAEERAELDPKAAQDLISIAADGDAAIRQLNAMIALYNDLKDKANGER
jgi:prophage endopeptidase